jgi:hypothetical protein
MHLTLISHGAFPLLLASSRHSPTSKINVCSRKNPDHAGFPHRRTMLMLLLAAFSNQWSTSRELVNPEAADCDLASLK